MASQRKIQKRYCVFGCDTELSTYMHSFPHPIKRQELFNTWVSIVGDKLITEDPMKIFKNKKVCDHHFTSSHKMACHRIIPDAVPCQYLNGYFTNEMASVTHEHNYCIPRVYKSPTRPAISNILDAGSSIEQQIMSTFDDALNNKPSTSGQQSIKDSEQPIIHSFDDNLSNMPSSSGEKSKTVEKSSIFVKYKKSLKKSRDLQQKLKRMRKQKLNFKSRLAVAQKKLVGFDAFDNVTKNMSLAGKIFTGIQYRQSKKKAKGRRYNLKEKILSLSIYKKSPKCYSFMSKYFKLPSARSLKLLLSNIKMSPGINEMVFGKLKDAVDGLSTQESLCTLIFDEMSITPQVQYNNNTDDLRGFDNVSNDELKIANHALVFMVRGITKNYKQPVAYYFTQSLKKIELKNIIKEVLVNVQNTGLKVVCTVCDQGASNVSAINSLIEDTRGDYLRKNKEWRDHAYRVGGQKIIHLYDVPHIIKGLRNNLLTKDLKYKDPADGTQKIVKWRYFQMLYEADQGYGELRLVPKLTEEHVVPEKIKKMRVKNAVQVFSRSVAVATKHLVDKKTLPEECMNVVPIVLIIDKLFDSLNANHFYMCNSKEFTGGVRINSPHHKLWQSAITLFKDVKYIQLKNVGNSNRITDKNVPSTVNLIKTIEGIQSLWKVLSGKYGIDCLLTRNLNQDPIENFFGNIRSLGVRNVSPNSQIFESSFKTLLLNNFSVLHASNANCEEDFSNCLQSIEYMIKKDNNLNNKQSNENIEIRVSSELFDSFSNIPEEIDSQGQYVCGWVLKKCLIKIIKGCKSCKNDLVSSSPIPYITDKEYHSNKRWLVYPSENAQKCFRVIQHITTLYLKNAVKKEKLRENIKLFVEFFVEYPFKCKRHSEPLRKYFTNTSINLLIFSWCKSINRILAGKITYTGNDDVIKKKAQIFYNVHKNRK